MGVLIEHCSSEKPVKIIADVCDRARLALRKRNTALTLGCFDMGLDCLLGGRFVRNVHLRSLQNNLYTDYPQNQKCSKSQREAQEDDAVIWLFEFRELFGFFDRGIN